jgi:hypothetical protein
MKKTTTTPAKATNTVTLTWSGREWNVSASVPPERLRINHAFTVNLPDEAVRRDLPTGEKRLLFPKDTWLYLPVKATHDQATLDRNVGKHFHEHTLRLPPGDKSYVPLQLMEDLCVRKPKGDGNWPSTQCKCQIAGMRKVFDSVNCAAQHALRTWTNRTGAVCVFSEVTFRHKTSYLCLDHQRRHVVDGIPLPETQDPGKDTMILPGLEKILDATEG